MYSICKVNENSKKGKKRYQNISFLPLGKWAKEVSGTSENIVNLKHTVCIMINFIRFYLNQEHFLHWFFRAFRYLSSLIQSLHCSQRVELSVVSLFVEKNTEKERMAIWTSYRCPLRYQKLSTTIWMRASVIFLCLLTHVEAQNRGSQNHILMLCSNAHIVCWRK